MSSVIWHSLHLEHSPAENYLKTYIEMVTLNKDFLKTDALLS